jgi:uncharacterized OsmC-like protein
MTHSLQEAQASLRAQYKANPGLAMVTDHASTRSTDLTDPFHSLVIPKAGSDATVAIGVHSAVGGPYDAPCPGDLLCAALAACQESSIRLVAANMGIQLTALQVDVDGTVDVRGALGIQKDVPVGFQSITVDIHLQAQAGTPPEMLEKLRVAAERCCVVMRTLQAPPPVQTVYHM